MPATEQQRFFGILSAYAFRSAEMGHQELFGHLADDEFTAQDSAEYLEVSMSTLRRIVAAGKLIPSSTVGRSQLFSVPDLKAFKKALKATKG